MSPERLGVQLMDALERVIVRRTREELRDAAPGRREAMTTDINRAKTAILGDDVRACRRALIELRGWEDEP